MFKKLGVVTALAGTVLFGGAFTPAHAQTNQGQSNGHSYKVYYSVNTNCSHLSNQEIQKILNQYAGGHHYESYHLNWYQPKASWQSDQGQSKTTTDKNSQANQQQTQTKWHQQQNQGQSQTQKQSQSNQQQPTQKQTQPTQQQGYQLSQFEKEVVKLTNQQRTQRGLQPLKINLNLSKMSRDKSQDMANNHYFSHQSPTYGSPFDMMKEYGISYSWAGENIAEGQRTPQEVVNAWMNSPGHRANILNAHYTEIGVGYVANGHIWTQDFIGK